MNRKSLFLGAIWLLIFLTYGLCIHLLPLLDSTESRYADMARRMLETGDWITPSYDYGIPFWAKPPLFAWLSALSMSLFGINEFGARFPSFVIGFLVALILSLVAKKRLSKEAAFLSGTIFLSLAGFIGMMGVMTDPSLALSIVLVMFSFYEFMEGKSSQKNLWAALLFFGLGLGLLAKGPLIGVLSVIPIALWALTSSRFLKALKKIPWIWGIPLMLLIALPWYIAAEIKTPGFLNYFIIGEHFKRFLINGWTGDLYGHAHSEPIGSIWLFWLGGIFPWFLVLFPLLGLRRKKLKTLLWGPEEKGLWGRYLLFWALWTPLFFTPARNIIASYPMPALAPIALLISLLWLEGKDSKKLHWMHWAWVGLLSLLVPLLVLYGSYYKHQRPEKLPKYAMKNIAHAFLERAQKNSLLYYDAHRYYSLEFYTLGAARQVHCLAAFEELTHNQSVDYIILHASFQKNIPYASLVQKHFHLIFKNQSLSLWEEKTPLLSNTKKTPTLKGAALLRHTQKLCNYKPT